MNQPVHGYLRFCFELSEWGLEPKLPVIGKPDHPRSVAGFHFDDTALSGLISDGCSAARLEDDGECEPSE
jgi:hypothetical protein